MTNTYRSTIRFLLRARPLYFVTRIITAFIAIRFGHHYPSHDSLRPWVEARSPGCNLASRRLSDGRDFSTYPRLQIAFCTGVARLCARGPTVQRRIQRPHYVPVSCIRRQQRRRVAATRTRGPAYVSHGCTHPCIRARAVERDSAKFQWVPKPTFFCAFRIALGFDTCCFLARHPLSRAAGCVYRATIEPRFREIVCHEFGGIGRY